MVSKDARVVITGGAGLVGRNLIHQLRAAGYRNLVSIDKHPAGNGKLRSIAPDIEVIEGDLAEPGAWAEIFSGSEVLVLNHAQISGLTYDILERNNVTATRNVLEAAKRAGISFIIHISSSVVLSQADDFYSRSKRKQEEMVRAFGIAHCVLRPTLMFGWFDRKHLGWLRRFLELAPVFPVPGSGAYIRQPLFVGDLCTVIIACMEQEPKGEVFDISGHEQIPYIDIIRTIKRETGSRTPIVKIPYSIFWALLWLAGKILPNPPFTTQQLEALVIPETFPVIDWPARFGVRRTPFSEAVRITFVEGEPAHAEERG